MPAILRELHYGRARRASGRASRISGVEERQRVVAATERRGGRDPEPLLEHRRVDLPEVDARLEVAFRVEVGQAGRFSDKSALDARAGEKYGAGGAVVSTVRPVLFDAAAELAEAEHGHAVIELGAREIVVECPQDPGQLGEQLGVAPELEAVRVV